jgi:hypothetical protein
MFKVYRNRYEWRGVPVIALKSYQIKCKNMTNFTANMLHIRTYHYQNLSQFYHNDQKP